MRAEVFFSIRNFNFDSLQFALIYIEIFHSLNRQNNISDLPEVGKLKCLPMLRALVLLGRYYKKNVTYKSI